MIPPARLRVGACLSLTGDFARFGRQAAAALRAWRSLDGEAELTVEDDRSDARTLEAVLPAVAARCDLLLGPYSSLLARTAVRVAADAGVLLWNHGGADDAAAAHPGQVVSVLTPASRYAEPFLRRLAGRPGGGLWITRGKGRFARQVALGAERAARRLGIGAMLSGEPGTLPGGPARGAAPRASWDLLTAGAFEEDVDTVRRARALPCPPGRICSVAAGVREFGRAAGDPDGVFGVAQWFPAVAGHRPRSAGRTVPGSGPELGPDEAGFLRAYRAEANAVPDYPAVQALASAVIAAHCARLAGGTGREQLWRAAASLETATIFGGFGIDTATGAQARHETVLLRWSDGVLAPA